MAEYPKYRSADPVEIENRQWPSRRITAPPVWASVDLRDGNQAFIRPMDVAAKLRYFQMLAQIGFREIEVGYPAASKEEFAFLRQLIEEGQIPENVRISVLTAARPDLIERTIEAIRGVDRATIHCYAATSELHRRFVFNKSEQELTEMHNQSRVNTNGLAVLRTNLDAHIGDLHRWQKFLEGRAAEVEDPLEEVERISEELDKASFQEQLNILSTVLQEESVQMGKILKERQKEREANGEEVEDSEEEQHDSSSEDEKPQKPQKQQQKGKKRPRGDGSNAKQPPAKKARRPDFGKRGRRKRAQLKQRNSPANRPPSRRPRPPRRK